MAAIIITNHAAQRLRQRRRFYKHGGKSGLSAFKLRLGERIASGYVTIEPPSWYRGKEHEGARYVALTPTLCAAIVRGRGHKWVCSTVLTAGG